MKFSIKKSTKKGKKFMAIFDCPKCKKKKIVHFGAEGMSDFTKHKDEERKQRYINRHKKNENWSDPKTAGFMSKHLLWNKPTLSESIKYTNNRFKNINIKYKN